MSAPAVKSKTPAAKHEAVVAWSGVAGEESPCRPDERVFRLRGTNDLLRNLLRDELQELRIAFFCECLRPGCYGPVWLTAAAYEERVATGDEIVLPGHRAALRASDEALPDAA